MIHYGKPNFLFHAQDAVYHPARNQAAALGVVTRNRTRGQRSGSTIKLLLIAPASEAWTGRAEAEPTWVRGVCNDRPKSLSHTSDRAKTPHQVNAEAQCCHPQLSTPGTHANGYSGEMPCASIRNYRSIQRGSLHKFRTLHFAAHPTAPIILYPMNHVAACLSSLITTNRMLHAMLRASCCKDNKTTFGIQGHQFSRVLPSRCENGQSASDVKLNLREH